MISLVCIQIGGKLVNDKIIFLLRFVHSYNSLVCRPQERV